MGWLRGGLMCPPLRSDEYSLFHKEEKISYLAQKWVFGRCKGKRMGWRIVINECHLWQALHAILSKLKVSAVNYYYSNITEKKREAHKVTVAYWSRADCWQVMAPELELRLYDSKDYGFNTIHTASLSCSHPVGRLSLSKGPPPHVLPLWATRTSLLPDL